MSPLLNEEHRAWIGRAGEPATVEIHRSDIVKYSIATEQQQDKYLRGDEAPLMFIFNLFRARQPIAMLRPDGLADEAGFPVLPLPRIMAGGTEVLLHRAIKPGDVLTGVSTITDLYEKAGRQGPLIFAVQELRVTDADGAPVYTESQTRIAR